MKTGPSGALAQRFLTSKITPLLIGASLLAGIGGLLTTPREEEPQIRVPMIAWWPDSGLAAEVELCGGASSARSGDSGIDYVYSASRGRRPGHGAPVGTDPETALTLVRRCRPRGSHSARGTAPLVTLRHRRGRS
jgi:hypothetical protein